MVVEWKLNWWFSIVFCMWWYHLYLVYQHCCLSVFGFYLVLSSRFFAIKTFGCHMVCRRDTIFIVLCFQFVLFLCMNFIWALHASNMCHPLSFIWSHEPHTQRLVTGKTYPRGTITSWSRSMQRHGILYIHYERVDIDRALSPLDSMESQLFYVGPSPFIQYMQKGMKKVGIFFVYIKNSVSFSHVLKL